MNRTLRAIALAGATVLFHASPSLAQYRPPPVTEGERLTNEGDEARLEGARALARGDKKQGHARLQKAVEHYRNALKANPDALQAAVGLGEAASLLGDYPAVITHLDALSPTQKRTPEIAFHLGVALLKSSRMEEAVPLLETAAQSEKPEFLISRYYLGRHYLQQGRSQDGLLHLTRFLQQRPERLSRNDHEIHFLIGHANLQLKRPREARAAFQAAQQGRPEALAIQMGLSATLELENRRDDAVRLLEGIATRFPQAVEPRERQGWLLLDRQDFEQAEKTAQAALRLQETATGRQLLGEIRLAQKKPAQAEPALRRAVELDPQLLQARFSLARAVQLQGRNDEAAALLEAVVKGGLDLPELWAVLGSVYRRAGRFQDAVQAHRRVVQKLPEQPWGHLLLGADYYATGQWEEAIREYENALKLDPQEARARQWLAQALLQRARGLARAQQLEDAARDLRRAADLSRTAQMARSLGAVLLTAGEYAEAQAFLDKNRGLPGASWRDDFLLGYARLGAGAAAAAVAAFEDAARSVQDPSALSEIYAGWALAKVETGELDTAVAKLMEPSQSKAAADVMQRNLPVALVRRALDKLSQLDVESATRDVEMAEKLSAGNPSLSGLALLARALVQAEGGNFSGARVSLKKAMSGPPQKWQTPATASLADAYLSYRQSNIPSARRMITQVKKRTSADQAAYLVQFERALDRREGELLYARSALPAADKVLKRALAEDPLNPFVVHNYATVRYRTGKTQEAVAAWEQVAPAVPAAHLNLGIDAQVRQSDFKAAVNHYARYVAVSGQKANRVREWQQRLQMIYGVAAATLPTPAGGEQPAPETDADAPAPTFAAPTQP
jgi:tetratricopeptide (TPR) repeat protein